jgi:hypothetical protein
MTSRRCHVITWPLLVGAVACNGGELSRSHAAKELAARFNGSAGSIRVFRTKCVEKYFEKYPIRFIEDAQLARQYRSLEDAGLATQFGKPATSEQCGTPYPESLRVIGMTLTPKGVAQQWPEHRERGGGWDVALGNREFVGVTAILPQPDPTLARVEFLWRVIPTAGGAALGQTSAPHGGIATFRRDDGGWRFMRMGY